MQAATAQGAMQWNSSSKRRACSTRSSPSTLMSAIPFLHPWTLAKAETWGRHASVSIALSCAQQTKNENDEHDQAYDRVRAIAFQGKSHHRQHHARNRRRDQHKESELNQSLAL